MAPFRQNLLILLLPLALTAAGVPGGSKPVISPVALAPIAEKHLPNKHNSFFPVEKKAQDGHRDGGR